MPWGPGVSPRPARTFESSPLSPPPEIDRGGWGGKRASERDPTGPGVVAGILGADFICRMSTSRAGEAGPGRGTQNARLGRLFRRERKRKKGEETRDRGEVHGTPDWTQTGQDQTAINSPLDLSCPTPARSRAPMDPVTLGTDDFSSRANHFHALTKPRSLLALEDFLYLHR